MMDGLKASLAIGASGLRAQSERLRVVSQNIANASTTAATPGGEPYRRQTISFAAELDEAAGGIIVRTDTIAPDQRPFRTELDPHHPAADASGHVKLPNVDPLIELADGREASRMYQANLQVLRQAKDLVSMTIDLMRTP